MKPLNARIRLLTILQASLSILVLLPPLALAPESVFEESDCRPPRSPVRSFIRRNAPKSRDFAAGQPLSRPRRSDHRNTQTGSESAVFRPPSVPPTAGEGSLGALTAPRFPPVPLTEEDGSTGWWADVQEDLRRREYHVTWQESPLFPGIPAGYQAPNRAQNLRIGFYPSAVLFVPRTPAQPSPWQGEGEGEGWTWGLTLTGYGRGEPLRQLPEATPNPQTNRVEYRRGPITEWYVNDEHGLEQTFQISNPKPQTPNLQSPIVLELTLTGDLTPHLTDDNQAIELTTTGAPSTGSGQAPSTGHSGELAEPSGQAPSAGHRDELAEPSGQRTPVLRYGFPRATDATGRQLPTHIELLRHHAPPNTQHASRFTSHVSRFTSHASRFTHYVLRFTYYVLRFTIDDSTATYPITLRLTIAALPPSAGWIGESNQDNAQLGHALSTAGDVNGDGYSDLIVGAPWYDSGQPDEGAAFVYYGSATGLGSTPAWSAEGDQQDTHFGTAVSIAGDVNGDGYVDVIIGAPDYDGDQTGEGAAFVYHGGPTGLATTPTWTVHPTDQENAHFGYSVSTAGDVDGDGHADVIVGVPDYDGDQTSEGAAFVYQGGAGGLAATPAWSAHPTDQVYAHFGTAVSTAGDVNGDGYADVIVGAPDYDGDQTGEGAAFVYQGGSGGLAATPAWSPHPTDQENGHFGYSVSTAGDVNGDGYSDVIVGAPNHDGEQPGEGAAFAYHGGPTGLATTPTWTVHPTNQENGHFGAAVSIAGDVNSDGYADVVIGAPDYDDVQTDEGAAFVYQGGAGGLAATPAWSAHPTDQVYAHFGCSVSTAGDVDGDGHGDLAIGATGYDDGHTDEGGAFVYHGSPGGLAASSTWSTTGKQAGVLLGWSVSTAGDVNGDGYSDVIVGAPRYDHGQAEEGVVFFYAGGPDGPATSPAWMGESDQEWAWFGYTVATAGDVNNDGYSDIIVGTPRYDGEQENEKDEGAAFVYYGSSTGLTTGSADWTTTGDQENARFGTAASTAGDVNGDGYADVIITANGYDAEQTNEGAAFVYYGGPTGLVTTTTWIAHPTDQAYANFGRSASTAGDVNGDGYSDVIIGAPWYDDPEIGEADDKIYDGIAFVYHGSATGLSLDPDWTVPDSFENAELGIAVSTAGDVNGDGYSDVIVGAYKYTEILDVTPWREGAALAYHGSPTGLTTGSADWMVTGEQESAKFGLTVSTAGDVNGDGYADVVVGAPNYADGQSQEGAASVYYGSSTGLTTGSADWSAQGNQKGAGYGFSVSTAGDVNGDGYSDLIIGAPTYNYGWTDEGRAFVYLGNGGGGLPVRPRQLRSDGSAPIAPLGRSDSADQVRLQVTARSPLGRVPVVLQWQLAPLGTPFTAATAISGTSPAWSHVLTNGLVLSQTVDGLTGDTVYRWRVRILYRPGNRLGQTGSRWLYLPWNGPQEADFRTPSLLSPDWSPRPFLPWILRDLPLPFQRRPSRSEATYRGQAGCP